MDVLGLSHHFRFVLGGDAVARPKPAPDQVEAALGRGVFPRERTVIVGDHPVDIQMGNAANVGASIGVLTGLSDERAFVGLGCAVAHDLTFLNVVERD
jgi:phosphoglycolate phosphatase-like HAD superfamily hydrolase